MEKLTQEIKLLNVLISVGYKMGDFYQVKILRKRKEKLTKKLNYLFKKINK